MNRKAAGRVAAGHPWIFQSDVVETGGAAPGDAVRVVDPANRLLGTAHYSAASQITLRMLDSNATEIGRDFFRARIAAAQAHRDRVVRQTNAYRLVHAEADRLPALIIDRYGDCFVVQTQNQGMDRAKEEILAVLDELYAPRAMVLRNDASVRKLEKLPLEKLVVRGTLPEVLEVEMNGLTLRADLMEGQKTGVFLDQRENYVAAQRHARGKALDCFASTGGFALHLAQCCEQVEAVDASPFALATAQANAARHGMANITFKEADVFALLTGYVAARRRFDTIVLDPPAFAKSKQTVDKALAGYKDINLRALKLLEPGGVLISCSCSHHVSEAALLEVIAEASIDVGRTLRVLERRLQAADHPVLLTVPETLYLKYVALEVI